MQSCWYGVKKLPGEEKNSKIIDASEGKTFISRDILVKLCVKVGNRVSIEYYQVLGLFDKHHNKWFLPWDDDRIEFKSASKKNL